MFSARLRSGAPGVISAALFVVLLLAAVCLTGLRTARLAAHGNIVRVTCEIYYPFVFVIIYGLAAIPLLHQSPAHFPSYVGVDFTAFDILFAFALMMTGAAAYFAGFNLAYRAPANPTPANGPAKTSRSEPGDTAFGAGAIALALLDLMVRLRQVASGQYFDWMRGFAADLNGSPQSALWLLQDGLAPILAAIATHRSRKNRAWLFYLLLLLFALVLEGKRAKLLLALAAVLAVHFVLHRARIGLLRLAAYALVGTLGLGFASNVIIEARIHFRSNISTALSDPAGFVQDMVFELAPRAAANLFRGSASDYSVVRGATLGERVPTWMIALASETRRVGEKGHLPARHMGEEMAIVVPSALWIGEKPSVSISTVIAEHYDLWTPGKRAVTADLASTSFVNPYLYFGLPGLCLYALLFGALVGGTARYVIGRFGINGMLLMAGSVYYLRPLSNSLAGPIVGLRNFALIILVFLVAEALARVFLQSRNARSRRA